MGWFEQKIDRCSRVYTVKRLTVFLIVWSAYGTVGLVQIVKYFTSKDAFYLFAGTFNVLLACLMIWFFASILQAVARNLAEGASSPTETL
jgi:hypothetical protein